MATKQNKPRQTRSTVAQISWSEISLPIAIVDMSSQNELESLWLQAPEGKLCGREQAKAWALREVWKSEGKGDYGMLTFIASKLMKNKDGKPSPNEQPTKGSVKEFFEKIDADANWFPGKQSDTRRGPKRVLSGVKITAIVSACKKMRKEEDEATYNEVVARCPLATMNPETGEPVDKKLVYRVFRENCHDEGADDNWDHLTLMAQTALDEPAMARRFLFAQHMKSLRHTAGWFYNHVVWVDLCSSVLPRTQRMSIKLKKARKGKKGWGSPSQRHKSKNKRLPPNAAKVNSSDTIRVWFVPILTRGKLHIEPLSANFPGETEDGAAEMVARVRAALNIRFQGSTPPKLLFSDRGNGFYESNSGAITTGYRNALRTHGLKAFFGDDASVQPGQLQDYLLHETTMAWMRDRLKKTCPKKSWEETVEAYHSRLKQCAAYCNDKYNIESLCNEVPWRTEELLKREGDRIPR